MEEAAAVRRAARACVADVEPARLREELQSVLDGGSMVPGVLTLLTARGHAPGGDEEALAERAAGVQLIYDGLRLTRRLVREEPWTAGETDADAGDIAVLAADVMVARGFYVLARTDAAEAAVGVVRSFGRDQTERRVHDEPELDAQLEADALELAAVAGAAATGSEPSGELLTLAAEIAADAGDAFPPAGTVFSDSRTGRLARATGGSPADVRGGASADP
jgi:hypothetical protein